MLLGNPRNTGHGDLGLHLRLTKQSTFWGSIWGGWQGQFWVKKADKDWRLSNRPGHSYSPDSGVWCQCIGEVERTTGLGVRDFMKEGNFFLYPLRSLSFPGGSDGKASAYSEGDLGSIPGLGRSPGEGNGNPLQYSCLEKPTDGGAW